MPITIDRRRPVAIAALAAALLAVAGGAARAEIHESIGAHGEPVFSNLPRGAESQRPPAGGATPGEPLTSPQPPEPPDLIAAGAPGADLPPAEAAAAVPGKAFLAED